MTHLNWSNRNFLLPVFLLIQILFIPLLQFFPDSIEKYYSTGFYPKIAYFLHLSFGFMPFSVGDVLYFFGILFVIRWFWKQRKSWPTNWRKNSLSILSFVSIFYFVFHLFWGFNYYRKPLTEKMQLSKEYSEDELVAFTKKLIAKTNAIQLQITQNKNQPIRLPYTHQQVFQLNLAAYEKLAVEHPDFQYNQLSLKKSLFSLPLTYMGFGGYLNPFTNEAQVNSLVPLVHLPTISCHEMAHQMGFASESECNFIGFLASVNTADLYSQYSGYSFALAYCLNNWSVRNPNLHKQFVQKVHPGILKNYAENKAFWSAYQTPIETGFHWFYDHFLKWNQQKDGMESYSKFVNLLVQYYQTNDKENLKRER